MFCSPLQTMKMAAAPLGLMLVLPAFGQHYKQTNLTADQPSVAPVQDVNLVNPWGLSRATGSPWWVSDNGTGLSTLYDGAGGIKPLVVTIPSGDPKTNPTGNPTGTVFHSGPGFALTNGKPAVFMFVTEDGTVSGWNGGTAATIMVNTMGTSVFKGAALATFKNKQGMDVTYLYAADFRKGRVAVYDSAFQPVHFRNDDDHDGDHNDNDAFRDERLPQGFAPFNVQNIGGDIYVTFAMQDAKKHDEVDGPGMGYVDVFSPTGHLLRRLEHGWWLNSPWALAMAPGDFGPYSHDVLVGNFGSGMIAVYDGATGHFKDMLRDSSNSPIWIGGLWALSFGSGGTSGPATSLYFTAGSDGEQHGLFGTITPVENAFGNSN